MLLRGPALFSRRPTTTRDHSQGRWHLPGAVQPITAQHGKRRPRKKQHCGNCKEGNGEGAARVAAVQQEQPTAQPAQASMAAPDAPPTQHPAQAVAAVPPRLTGWPPKSDLYILRSDGMSCTRETVAACGSLSFSCPSSQQHLLVWKSKPQCAMVLKKLGDELVGEFLEVVRYLGEEQGMRVLVEPHEYANLTPMRLPYLETFNSADAPSLHSYVDFVACLGGDGLILHASLLFKSAIPPIISFKLGSLGFLTCHEFKDFRRHLANMINGYQELESCKLLNSMDGSAIQGVYITLRMRLLCTVYRQGYPGEEYEVLNEVVVSRGANPFLTKIEVYEHDTLITKVQADGVMLATPTGSTAYNVAAGGSMVHPNVPAIMFTPICPHSLSFRPIILPDYSELEFRISDDARSPALVCLDGKVYTELQIGDSVHVRMSPNPVPTINNADQTTDWFNSIERCFHWNERLEQRRLQQAPTPDGSFTFYTMDSDIEESGPRLAVPLPPATPEAAAAKPIPPAKARAAAAAAAAAAAEAGAGAANGSTGAAAAPAAKKSGRAVSSHSSK